jgi:hypothetical protein
MAQVQERQLLLKQAGAAGGAEFGFTTSQHGDPNNSDNGFLAIRTNISGQSFASTGTISGSVWFRALIGDFGSAREFGFILAGTPDNSGLRHLELSLNRKGDGDGDSDDHSIVLSVAYPSATRSVTSFHASNDFFSSNADFDSKVLDGKWHNISFVFSRVNTDRQLLLDGVDINRTRLDGPGSTVADTVGGVTQNIPLTGSSYTGTNPPVAGMDTGNVFYNGMQQGPPSNFGAAFDIGPYWFYDSEIDFSDSSTLAKYYNSSNTDGYVTAGSDGTSGGAATAELFITTDGSSMNNGGSLSNATFHELGTGFSKSDNTNGPGSGSTRTTANT